MTQHFALAALAAVAIAGCEQSHAITNPQTPLRAPLEAQGANLDAGTVGAVYTLTNQVQGNQFPRWKGADPA
jgi:hypothetical protein